MLRPVEGLELLDPPALQPGDALVQQARLGIERLAYAVQATRKSPEPGIGRLGSLDEENAELAAGESEHGQVDRDRAAGDFELGVPVYESRARRALHHPMLHLISIGSVSGPTGI